VNGRLNADAAPAKLVKLCIPFTLLGIIFCILWKTETPLSFNVLSVEAGKSSATTMPREVYRPDVELLWKNGPVEQKRSVSVQKSKQVMSLGYKYYTVTYLNSRCLQCVETAATITRC